VKNCSPIALLKKYKQPWDANKLVMNKTTATVLKIILAVMVIFSLPACSNQAGYSSQTKASAGIDLSTQPPLASPTPFEPLPTITTPPNPTVIPINPTLASGEWKKMPVVPEGVSSTTLGIYEKGLALNNNPKAFSKVGDCESSAEWFLGDFDKGPGRFSLGEHTELQGVIMEFQGSFNRRSLAAERSFTTASVLSPLWANPDLCQGGETPLDCEYRIHKPAYAIIMLGTNEALSPIRTFESNLRRIIETTIHKGIVPILTTKADNLEGNGAVNEVIVRLAREYEIPLWNFWAAVQLLPGGGLQEDGAHLTYASNRFDDPFAMQRAWPVRNLTALQTLDAIWLGITGAQQ
jgi:hypothetical protein